METESYVAYSAICNELGLEPASNVRFQSIATTDLANARVVALGQAALTWVLVRDDARDGCSGCLAATPSFIEHFYSGDEAPSFSDEDATHLLIRFHVLHDLSIAVTNAYGAQNWSCVVGVANCRGCAAARTHLTPPAIGELWLFM